MIAPSFGWIALFGSGETAPSGRKTWDQLLRRLHSQAEIAILETPAGFQPNSAQVAGEIADFLIHHLQNYAPKITLIAARHRASAHNPDHPDIAAPMQQTNVLFLGPGSPTYAARHLRDTLVWRTLLDRHQQGAAIVLASAAVAAVSAHVLPVYEIYKAGADLHWQPGLDLFGRFGLNLVFVPHWNNHEGGVKLDTSRCFMGEERFARLHALLPAESVVVGIDEHTTLLFDLARGKAEVLGLGGVTVCMTRTARPTCDRDHPLRFAAGHTFDLDLLGPFRLPEPPTAAPDVAAVIPSSFAAMPSPEVMALATAREQARSEKRWRAADELRQSILALGWQVQDTPTGPHLVPR